MFEENHVNRNKLVQNERGPGAHAQYKKSTAQKKKERARERERERRERENLPRKCMTPLTHKLDCPIVPTNTRSWSNSTLIPPHRNPDPAWQTYLFTSENTQA